MDIPCALFIEESFFITVKFIPREIIGSKPLIKLSIITQKPYSFIPKLYVIMGIMKKLDSLVINSERNLNFIT